MEVTSIEEFLRYHDRVHARTRAVVDRIPKNRLEWTPVEGRFTLGDLVRHVAATERWMFAENVQGRPSAYPGHGPDLASGLNAVIGYFERMHDETRAIVAGLTPEALQEKCPTVGGIEIRIWKWLRAMVEHEIHHRGQLYTMLGLLGVEAPPLYGLTERQVFANSHPEGAR